MKKFSKLFLAIALIVCLTASTVACAKKHHQYVDDTPKNPKVTAEKMGAPAADTSENITEKPDIDNAEKPGNDSAEKPDNDSTEKPGNDNTEKTGDDEKKGDFSIGEDTGLGYGELRPPRK